MTSTASDAHNTIDRLRDMLAHGGVSEPLKAIEQVTYLIFLRRLDDLQNLKERRARHIGKLEDPIYLPGQERLRWSRFKDLPPEQMLVTIRDEVFPWLSHLGSAGGAYARHLRGSECAIRDANLLARVVDLIAELPMSAGDEKGDLYEYLLAGIPTSAKDGRFRTPRHLIGLMVAMLAPMPGDLICDPACGTAGFLIGAAAHIADTHREALLDLTLRKHFDKNMFHGFDSDETMVRIAGMNTMLHDIAEAEVINRNSLGESNSSESEQFSILLMNPPFNARLDNENIATDLQRLGKTKKTNYCSSC